MFSQVLKYMYNKDPPPYANRSADLALVPFLILNTVSLAYIANLEKLPKIPVESKTLPNSCLKLNLSN